MCGITGILSRNGVDPTLLTAMARRLRHRGPDDEGIWLDGEARIGLAHRRLSVIDLSPAGHQPMVSSSGRFVLTFNGEIYNHSELRISLEQEGLGPPAAGQAWRGNSDTETLLEAVDAWGLKATLERTIGMFALALWDRTERRLHLVRDRFGEKPLYYGRVGKDFVFASELKAIHCHPGFDNPIDRSALAMLVSHGYIPAPASIYEAIHKLRPGVVLTIDGAPDADLRFERYWDYRDIIAAGGRDPFETEEEAAEQLEVALSAAVARQSIADVPLGVFLSGGIDSSTIAALSQKQSAIPVRTFSIGFHEASFNEANHAKAVAVHLGTKHHEHYVGAADAQAVIPLLPEMYDEPFADSSQIPTHIVSRFARGSVTVALSGDGGDELFGGYDRFVAAPMLWSQLSRLPAMVRKPVGIALERVPPTVWQWLVRRPNGGVRIQRLLRRMRRTDSWQDVYRSLLDEYYGEATPVLGAYSRPFEPFDLDPCPGAEPATRMMYCDAVSYLADDIMCKVDRASMAVSLETRAPFLDHRVAEVAARIPSRLKITGSQRKRILKRVLFAHVPEPLFDRPKQGFGLPVGEWLRGPLRAWAEDLLSPRTVAEEGYFDAGITQRRWIAHVRGERDAAGGLWSILMFQAWLRHHQRA